MKLLLDHNLSYRAVSRLSEDFDAVEHVQLIGMDEADDLDIWKYAKDFGLTIVSLDSDFLQMSILRGHPPKVIHLGFPNPSVKESIEILLNHRNDIERFSESSESSYLKIG